MLPLLYKDHAIARRIVEDADDAPIPPVHKAMYRWVEKFTRRSWEMTPEDCEAPRKAGVEDKHIADWANVAAMQTWWVMMADGGGSELDSGKETGTAVGIERDTYHGIEPGRLAAAPGPSPAETNGRENSAAWIARDEEAPEFKEAAGQAKDRYGFVPNLLRAVSLAPGAIVRHRYALELLERPQSPSLDPRRHALVRRLASRLNRSAYSDVTTEALAKRAGVSEAEERRLGAQWHREDWDETDRVVLEFAIKAARNAYKITGRDAKSFVEVGLDEKAYVDVLNTVAIQTSLDRLANALGVEPDEKASLPMD